MTLVRQWGRPTRAACPLIAAGVVCLTRPSAEPLTGPPPINTDG